MTWTKEDLKDPRFDLVRPMIMEMIEANRIASQPPFWECVFRRRWIMSRTAFARFRAAYVILSTKYMYEGVMGKWMADPDPRYETWASFDSWLHDKYEPQVFASAERDADAPWFRHIPILVDNDQIEDWKLSEPVYDHLDWVSTPPPADPTKETDRVRGVAVIDRVLQEAGAA